MFFRFFILFIIFHGAISSKAQSVLDSLLKDLYQTEDAVSLIKLEKIFDIPILKRVVKHENDDTCRKQMIHIFDKEVERVNSPFFKSIIYSKLSEVNTLVNKSTPLGIKNLKNAEKYVGRTKSDVAVFYFRMKKSAYFLQANKYDSALYFATKALEISKSIPHDSISNSANYFIGGVYYRGRLYSKAREYFLLAIKTDGKDARKHLTITNTIGVAYRNEGKHDSARLYFKKVIDRATFYKDTAWISIANGNIGSTYLLENENEKAIPYLLINLSLAARNKTKNHLDGNTINVVIGIAKAYLGLNDLKNAKIYKDSATHNMPYDKGRNKRVARNYYEMCALYYQKLGDYEQAFKLLEKFHHLKDSLELAEENQRAVEVQNQIEIEKHIEKEQSQALENEQKNKLIISFIIILILSFFLIYFLWKSNKLRNQNNKKLASQKEEISAQAEELRAINHKLVELDEFKQNMTSMIIHDLKNPLNALLNISPQKMVNYTEQIRSYAQQMQRLVLNILDIQKFEEAQISLDKRTVPIINIIENALNQVHFLISQKNILIKKDIQKNLYVYADQEMLERVFVNLLTNAIKYSSFNQEVQVKVKKNNEQLFCSIKDFGIGISEDKLHLVFNKFVQMEARSSIGMRSTGLGLTYCKMAIEAHHGIIDVTSQKGQGSEFWFKLPLTTPENQDFEEKNQENFALHEDSLELSNEDKFLLKPFLISLQKLEVYYVSDLESLLQSISFLENNERLKHWHNRLKNAIFTMNQPLYLQIVEEINS
ncbi:MAG: tetratricopeptide repeat-containing sensor histidine kinase [Raineya sp.]|jgi:signal transduction histidine kinase|nr:tetratricopeptide repeat-containing sensor histidine kinase [Raineya sp.]